MGRAEQTSRESEPSSQKRKWRGVGVQPSLAYCRESILSWTEGTSRIRRLELDVALQLSVALLLGSSYFGFFAAKKKRTSRKFQNVYSFADSCK